MSYANFNPEAQMFKLQLFTMRMASQSVVLYTNGQNLHYYYGGYTTVKNMLTYSPQHEVRDRMVLNFFACDKKIIFSRKNERICACFCLQNWEIRSKITLRFFVCVQFFCFHVNS